MQLKRWLLLLLALTGIMFMLETAVLAAGEAPQGQAWWQALLVFLVQNLLQIAGTVVATVVVTLLGRWKVKMDTATVENAVGLGISYVDQLTVKKLKAGQPKLPSAEKADLALVFIKSILDKTQLRKWTESKLKVLIEAKLGARPTADLPILTVTASPSAAEVVKAPDWASDR